MGCCATKPMVLKGNRAEEPIPKHGKETTGAKKAAEHDLNQHANNRRSLSNLFEEEGMKMTVKTPTRPKPELSKPVLTDTAKEVNVVTGEEAKEPMKRVKEIGNRNSESGQYMEVKSVHDIVADIEKLNKLKANVVPVPVALGKIELGRSAKAEPTPKAATDTKSAPDIPKGGNVIMNLKIEEIAYEIKQLYKPDMIDGCPGNIKSEKPEPGTSTDTDKLKDVDAISNQKFEKLSNDIEQIDKPDPTDVAPGNIGSIQPMEPKSAPEAAADVSIQPIESKSEPEAAAADTETLKETSISIQSREVESEPDTAKRKETISIQPMEIESEPETAADTEKLRETSISIRPMEAESEPETAANTKKLKETSISIQPMKVTKKLKETSISIQPIEAESEPEAAAAANTKKLKETSISIQRIEAESEPEAIVVTKNLKKIKVRINQEAGKPAKLLGQVPIA